MNDVDVTVVLAVYNAMPYLTACLESLAGQSIRRRPGGGLEVVAVDDGSTDGGGAELCAFAARHPGLVRVVHQPNSGGPAAPGNRALELARGRYVFFLGADDWLGEHALERLVALADRAESDVVLGRMVGVGGRQVPQGIFEANRDRITFTDSALAWALSDTKLFRRELIERHGLRKREDLPAYSDQPFTLEACLRSRRISVLADYDCYYAVLREDHGNVTVRARHEDRLRGVAAMLGVAERLAEPGAEREALRARAFSWEIPRLLTADFLALPEPAQRRVCAGVGRLVALHCEEAALAELPVRDRLRLDLARRGRVAALRRLIRYQAAYGERSAPAAQEQQAQDAAVEQAPEPRPLPVPVQLWRGLVPAQVRRRLHRSSGWREFTERTYERWA
ncbi:glycosyltransferase family 2 protein [Kitasatospora mediocidica]|uniref:glycosyltransferase family 2 protein n=1 Tax=Kitasatospora mediocidica TaxID=58352 RepID=UPI00068DD637|nr:glycosyltransferase family A protein [Kitasatospora mediocidica]